MTAAAPVRRTVPTSIERRTIEGRTVWVKRDACGIAMISARREDVDPDTSSQPTGSSG